MDRRHRTGRRGRGDLSDVEIERRAAAGPLANPVLADDGSVDVEASVDRLRRDLRTHGGVLVRLELLTRAGRERTERVIDLAREHWTERNRTS